MLKVKVKLGDCLDVLKRLPEGAVDCIVTDPPYGMTPVNPRGKKTKAKSGFMGKTWDVDVPSVKIWRACLRVLKPGAFGFVMCSPRQDCLAKLILRLQKAGFIVGYSSIYWITAQGFPKAKNLGKQADKRAGALREVAGKRKHPTLKDPTKVNRQGKHQFHAVNSIKDEWDITAPATPEAKALNGAYAGLQLKPALEVIVVVMKPITEPTYLDQALTNQKGCTWLDDCRVPLATQHNNVNRAGEETKNKRYTDRRSMNFAATPGTRGGSPEGRFPANVLVQDDALRGYGQTKSPNTYERKADGYNQTAYGKGVGESKGATSQNFGDAGSISRYFDLDAWFADRIGELPESAQQTFPFLYVPKPSRREKNAGLDNLEKRAKREVYGEGFSTATKVDPKIHTAEGMEMRPLHANTHPTVKSVKLMHYLVTLGSRPNDVVLDPFCGSGTTGVAAVTLQRHFFGIELDPEYREIAVARIRHAIETKPTKPRKTKPSTAKSIWRP